MNNSTPQPSSCTREPSRASRVLELVSRVGFAVLMAIASVWRILGMLLLAPFLVLAAPAIVFVMALRRSRAQNASATTA